MGAPMVLVWTVIAVLILLNALYVAAEFAAVAARRSRVRQMAEDGHMLAARLLPVLEDGHALDRYIAVSQVGITLSSLVLGAYGQATLAPRLRPVLHEWAGFDSLAADSASAFTVLLGLTAMQMVLGELVPKSVALQSPTRTAILTVLPMEWSLRLLKWPIALLNGSGLAVLRALRVPLTGHRHVHTPQEIEMLIAESRRGGLLEPSEQVRLSRALRLGLRTARDLMVPRSRLAAVEASTPFDDLLRAVAASPYSRLPVYRGTLDRVVGMVHTKDVMTAYLRHGEAATLASVVRPVVWVQDTMPADRLLAFLRERRMQQALVLDEGGVAGLITLEDVLAELLGGVDDEFKAAPIRAVRLADGRVRLPGAMRLDQAALLGAHRWKGTAPTIGAHVIASLGRVPAPGEQVVVDGCPIEIESADERAIDTLIAGEARPPDAEQDEA